MMELAKYSMGIGDRFGRQGRAQLRAFLMARDAGVTVVPVWNKSHREHTIVGTDPASVRREADDATAALGWGAAHHVDADHIGLGNVDPFLDACDFFTLDVAGLIDRSAGVVPAAAEAGRIYRRIAAHRGEGNFITEISMDEADAPQTPEEMRAFLSAVAGEGIPVQTIAPRFSGHFHKGVDYVGDVAGFERELEQHLEVIRWATRELGLPAGLKISVHSGSDKFSLYGPIRRAIRRHDAGLHLKTAGTTWLEEVIGLSEDGGEAMVREIVTGALGRRDELCAPYATVIDIDPARLPSAEIVARWDGEALAAALRHDPSCPRYNPHLRQLVHVAYKLAAEMGPRYLAALDRHREAIARDVTHNLFERHLRGLFLD
jgi:hypothetical protein